MAVRFRVNHFLELSSTLSSSNYGILPPYQAGDARLSCGTIAVVAPNLSWMTSKFEPKIRFRGKRGMT